MAFVTPDNHGQCGQPLWFQDTMNNVQRLSLLLGLDGAKYSAGAAFNLDLCPSGFHVPNDIEWGNFTANGGTVVPQLGPMYINYCGAGGTGVDTYQYCWSSSSYGSLWEFIDGEYSGWNECCYPEYGMNIKCVRD